MLPDYSNKGFYLPRHESKQLATLIFPFLDDSIQNQSLIGKDDCLSVWSNLKLHYYSINLWWNFFKM